MGKKPSAEKEKARWTYPTGFVLAERTGLEPATPGVTGRYSNRLNYRSSLLLTGGRRSIPAGGVAALLFGAAF